MSHRYLTLLTIFLSTFLLTACNGDTITEEQITFSALDELKDSDWENLAKKKIYFGHMSVGFNIIDGILDFKKKYPKLKLAIIESNEPEILQPGTLAHSKVGKNYNPHSKIVAYAAYLNAGLANKADVATLKLCYIDISKTTDINALFSEYTKTIDKLKLDYPDLTLVHCTVPLTKRETGLRSWIKRILGRGISDDENINRNKYNDLIRTQYNDSDLILDIATIESTYPNGKRSTFKSGKNVFFTLVPEYTYDTGHLNEIGRKKVAEQLLLLLAKMD